MTPERDVDRELEELQAANKALRDELEATRARLKLAQEEAAARALPRRLVWIPWLFVVLGLGAYLYSLLSGGAEQPSPTSPADMPRKALPVEVSAPPSPSTGEGRGDSPAPAAARRKNPSGSNLRFPGFPDITPKSGH